MTASLSPLPPGGVGGGHGGGAGQPTFTCVGSAYAIRRACLTRNWRALRAEMERAEKNGATVAAQVDAKSILIRVKRANSNGVDYINDLHFRDVIQIVESLRECGATIKETT